MISIEDRLCYSVGESGVHEVNAVPKMTACRNENGSIMFAR